MSNGPNFLHDEGSKADSIEIVDDIINNAEFNEKHTNMENAQYEDASDIIVTASEAHQNA